MATPQRVIDEARAAEQQMAEINKEMANPTGQQPPNDAPSNDEPAAPERARSGDTEFGVHQVVEPAQTPSGPIDAAAYAALQQKLASLEGNFGKLNTQLAETRGRNDTLERMIAARSEVPAAPAPSAAPTSSVSEAEETEFGPDLVDLMRRISRDTMGPILDKLQRIESGLSETKGIAQHSAQQAQSTSDDRFVSTMNKLVTDAKGAADWSEINTMHERGDSRFVDWLNEVGEDSDEPRLNIIRRAFTSRDANRCARMINRFKQSVRMADGTAKPAADDGAESQPAAELISPNATGSGSQAPSGKPAAKLYTKEDIDKHYDDKVKGKWKGRESKWQQIASDMDKAVGENRFVESTRRR